MKRQRSTYNLSFRSVISTIVGRLCTRLAVAKDSLKRGMLLPLWTLGFLLSALSGVSRAERYWVAWEGNDYPENEDWDRIVEGDGPANRSLSDGIMTLDGSWSTQVADVYVMQRPVNPEAGEIFVMQWRLRVNELEGHSFYPFDPGVGLFSDDDWALSFVFGLDRVRSDYEAWEFAIAANTFHTYELRSADMRTYSLALDGENVHSGTFWEPTTTRSLVGWGDALRGAASNSDWDYFRFGVVPEPTASTLLIVLCLTARTINPTRRFT